MWGKVNEKYTVFINKVYYSVRCSVKKNVRICERVCLFAFPLDAINAHEISTLLVYLLQFDATAVYSMVSQKLT